MKIFILMFLAAFMSAQAATLNVPRDYRTVQAAVDVAQPGDLVLVAAGVYAENVVTKRNGSAASRITIDGQGGAVLRRLILEHDYHIIKNLKVTGTTTLYSSQIHFAGGDHCRLDNVVVDCNRAYKVHGITWKATGGGSDNIIENCVVEKGWAYPMISMTGSRNILRKSTIRDGWDVDFLRLFGNDNLIQDNLFINNLPTPAEFGAASNHPDFVQTFGNNGEESYGHIIERNIVRNIPNAQLTQLSSTGQPNIRDWTFRNNVFFEIGLGASCTIPGVKYYNNVFYRANYVNKGNALNFGKRKYGFDTGLDPEHPLYPATTQPTPSGSLVVEGDDGKYQYGGYYDVVTPAIADNQALVVGHEYKVRCRYTARVLYNGVEYDNGQVFKVVSGVTSWKKTASNPDDLGSISLYLDAKLVYNGVTYLRDTFFKTVAGVRTFTVNYPGVYAYRVAVDYAHRCEARNNVFLDCGDPVNNLNGWYDFGLDLLNVAADHNYVGKNGFTPMRVRVGSIPVGDPRGWGGKGWYEPNGINGGDPGFASLPSLNFSLVSGSPLIDRGVALANVRDDHLGILRPLGGGYDIGAFEASGTLSVRPSSPQGFRVVLTD
jgi:hypothetical protein